MVALTHDRSRRATEAIRTPQQTGNLMSQQQTNPRTQTTSRKPSRKDHLPYEVRHIDDYEWEKIRWPGQNGKFVFHPRLERPREPNAGLLRFEPGSYHPEHYHGFSQVWYILSGE